MSQPRRRRRRKKRTGSDADPAKASQQKPQHPEQQKSAAPARRRRRRGRARGEARQTTSPKSSEDLVRASPKKRPAALTAPPDGQTLETIVGELQSQYGVPQYPQEYRITIKVADERESRGEQTVVEERSDPEPAQADGPKREKAPAPPVLMREGTTGPARSKRRRGRRGRRRRGGGAGNAGA